MAAFVAQKNDELNAPSRRAPVSCSSQSRLSAVIDGSTTHSPVAQKPLRPVCSTTSQGASGVYISQLSAKFTIPNARMRLSAARFPQRRMKSWAG